VAAVSTCILSTDENKYRARGLGRASINASASSTESTGHTGRIGPKISSLINVESEIEAQSEQEHTKRVRV
jgi:hypothetical protein